MSTDQAVSYVGLDGEWRTRKITLFGVVRSFVSQLKPGQDMTRVSLPAVLLYPYSMLEVFAHRELGAMEILYALNREEDPLERMLLVVKWNLAILQQETSHKKPYNPVLGEVHNAWTDSKDYGKTEFVGEQVSHHPPVSAFIVRNEQENITFECNLSFGVKFGGNYVSIVTEGNGLITDAKHNESYELPRRTPDMVVKNVIWGTRRIFWNGEVQIICSKTGYTTNLKFKESGHDNTVSGEVCSVDSEGNEEVIYKLDGKCGGIINLIDKRTGEKKLLFDAGSIKRPPIQYKPWNELDPLASTAVWADVNKYIIEDDMEKADEAKKKVEASQRERALEKKEQGLESTARFFEQSDAMWVVKKKKEVKTKKKRASSTGVTATPVTTPINGNEPQTLAVQQIETATDSQSDEESTAVRQSTSIKSLQPVGEIPFEEEKEGVDGVNMGTNGRSKMVNPKRASLPFPLKRDESKDRLPTKTDSTGSITGPKPQKLPDDVNMMTGWMKMRNSMKLWINRWFVLRPGRLIYYKDDKDMMRDRCVGIIRLADCRVHIRPTHKDGFSFKIYHLLHYPIYHKYGLKGENLKMARLPVSWNYCILRVGSEQERKSWMEAILGQIEYANTFDPTTARGPLGYDESELSEDETDEERSRREFSEDVFQKSDDIQKLLLDGLVEQQKSTNKLLKKRTTRIMEEWKKEIDTKMVNMEKRIITSVAKSNGGSSLSDGKLRVSYLQLVALVLFCFLLSRYL